MRHAILVTFTALAACGQLLGTAISLNTSTASVTYGQSVVLTATIVPAVTGTLTFVRDLEVIGSAPIDNSGLAVWTYRPALAGRSSVRAIFRGSPAHSRAISNSVVVTATPVAVPTSFTDPALVGFSAYDLVDLDGDTRLDAVRSLGYAVLSAKGASGGFGPVVASATVGTNSGIFADYDGDGRVDVAAVDLLAGGVRVSRGVGDGTFQPFNNVGIPLTQFIDMRSVDMNADGLSDLVLLKDVSNVVVYLSTGNGGFAPGPELWNRHISIGDFNGDGIADAIGFVAFDECRVFNGTGTTFLPTQHQVDCNPTFIRDFTGDGVLDLLYVTSQGGYLRRGIPGGGGFAQPVSATLPEHGYTQITDWNGDGSPDMLYMAAPEARIGEIHVHLNRGDGTFQPPTTVRFDLPRSAGSSRFSMLEIDGDGIPDLFLGDQWSRGRVGSLKPFSEYFDTRLVPLLGPDLVGGGFVDPDGVGDILDGYMLIGSSPSEAAGCLLRFSFYPQRLQLRNTAGVWVGVEGRNKVVSDGRCAVDQQSFGTTRLWPNGFAGYAKVEFAPSMAGAKIVYLRTVDRAGGDSGWVAASTYAVQPTGWFPSGWRITQRSPETVLTSARYAHANGLGAIRAVQFGYGGSRTCILEFSRTAGTVRLSADNAYDSWGPAVRVPSASVLENTHCSVNLSSFAASELNNEITVSAEVSFRGETSWRWEFTMGVQDASGAVTRRALEDYVVTLQAPEPRTLTPRVGSGTAATFDTTYSTAADAQHLYLAYLFFLPTPAPVWFTAKGACIVEYNTIGNTFRLINDAGTDWLPAAGEIWRPGARKISNSVCTVDVARSSVQPLNPELFRVSAAMEFQSGFSGVLATFLQSFGTNGKFSGVQQFGNWVVAPAGTPRPGPYIVGASGIPAPEFGFRTLNLTFGHTAGAASITQAHLRFVDLKDLYCHAVYFHDDGSLALIGHPGVLSQRIRPGDNVTISGGPCQVRGADYRRLVDGSNITLSIPMSGYLAAGAFAYATVFDTSGYTSHWVTVGQF